MIDDIISMGVESEPTGQVYNTILYNDRTNEEVIDFGKNAEIKDIESFEKMLPYISQDGCNRMLVKIDPFSYGKRERLYYRFSNNWKRIDQIKERFDLEEEDDKKHREENINCLKDEKSLSGIEAVMAFWQNRRAIRLALIELDPLCISRYPLLQTGMTAYAKESYDIAKKILGFSDENDIFYIIRYVLKDLDGVELTEDEKEYLSSRLFHGYLWQHVCPVCKLHYFHAEKDVCPICGWRNNLRQERNADSEVSTDNTEPLRLRQALYYLKKHEETREEAEKIWSEYTDLFNALIKVKKAFPGEQSTFDNVFVLGVNINDGCCGEFSKLRENTMKRLEELLSRIKTENTATRKNDENLERKVHEKEEQTEYTEMNHPGRDK